MANENSMDSRSSLSERVSVPRELILQAIHLIRGHKIMLDADLARLYEVETKTLTRGIPGGIPGTQTIISQGAS